MLTIINGTEALPLLESNYEKYEELNGTALQISFDSYSFQQNTGHDLLQSNVMIQDEDNHIYKVRQITRTTTGKRVLATHEFFDLVGYRINGSFTGNNSFNAYANFIFTGTGWTFQNADINTNANFNTFGNDNFLQLIQRLIIRFDVEFEILPNKVIRFARRIGRREDKQYRVGYNIEQVSESIDTTNVRTVIRANGVEGLTTRYVSPLASNPLFGYLEADPVTDTKITNLSELNDFARRSLNDVPATNIEASVIDTDGEVGDYVYVIHEELGIDIETRILSKITRRDYNQSTVEIGNTKIRTIEDAVIDQKQEVKDNKLETDEAIEETRQELETETNNIKVEISETANSIRLEVQEVDRSVSSLEIRADQIQSNVTNLENNKEVQFEK